MLPQGNCARCASCSFRLKFANNIHYKYLAACGQLKSSTCNQKQTRGQSILTKGDIARMQNKKSVLSQRWPRDVRNIIGSNEPLRRHGHSKLSKMAAWRQLGFNVTENSAIRSADPENPTREPNMKCIGSPVPEIWPFAYLGRMWNSILGKRRS